MTTCPYCKTSNPKGELFCTNCGYNLQPQKSAKDKKARQVAAEPVLEAPKVEPAVLEQPSSKTPQPSSPQMPLASLILPDNSAIAIFTESRIVSRDDIASAVPPDIAKYVSREHMRVTMENGKFYIEDGVSGKPSLNGTKLNNIEIKEKGKKHLSNGDEILMAGAVKLIFQITCKDCMTPIPVTNKECPKCAKPKKKGKKK